MSATKVMFLAIMLGVVGRWANNKHALPSASGTLEVIGALFLISLLDSGKTEPVAKGFAWLFFTAVLLSDSSPITGLAKAEGYAANQSSTAGSETPLPTFGPKGNTPRKAG